MTDFSVLLTMSGFLNSPLQNRLSTAGVNMQACALQTIEATELKEMERQKIVNLDQYDMLIFVSRNAVIHGCGMMVKYRDQLPAHLNWFAVGPGTGSMLEKEGIRCSYPKIGSSESLLELEALSSIKGQKVLIVRGVGGREQLKSEIENRGGTVEYLEVYQRVRTEFEPGALETMMTDKKVKMVVIASGEALKYFFSLISQSWMLDLEVVVPSDRIAAIAEEMGVRKISISRGAETESMFITIVSVYADIQKAMSA